MHFLTSPYLLQNVTVICLILQSRPTQEGGLITQWSSQFLPQELLYIYCSVTFYCFSFRISNKSIGWTASNQCSSFLLALAIPLSSSTFPPTSLGILLFHFCIKLVFDLQNLETDDCTKWEEEKRYHFNHLDSSLFLFYI